MKSFLEFISDEQHTLEEGVLGTAALVAMSNRSKAEGDRAVKAFKEGRRALSGRSADDTVDKRLERLELSIAALLEGMVALRGQIGSGVTVDLTGHLFSAKTGKQILKKK